MLLRAERGATELRIHVVDSGAGLPDEQRDALFQPFRRGTAAQRGSGLGLAIARGFAEANGGRLWAQDDPAGGHLVLSLPLAAREAVRAMSAASSSSTTSRRSCARCARACTARATKWRRQRPPRERSPRSRPTRLTPSCSISCCPDGSGTEVCRELRTWSSAPVIVLSVVGDEAEKIAALDAGADDYVTKPFGIDELLARLRAALRRADAPAEPVVEVGELRIDLEKRAVSVGGEPVQLTPHEFALLRVLARNPGKLLTHAMLLREVWGRGYGDESHYLHVYVSQLRRKLEAGPGPAALHPHRARRRLPARRAALEHFLSRPPNP